MAGLSNAVSLTDGLDGLAGGCVMVVMIFMAASNSLWRSNLLFYPHLSQAAYVWFCGLLLPCKHFYGRHRLSCWSLCLCSSSCHLPRLNYFPGHGRPFYRGTVNYHSVCQLQGN